MVNFQFFCDIGIAWVDEYLINRIKREFDIEYTSVNKEEYEIPIGDDKMKVWKLEADMTGFESFKLINEDKEFLRNFKKEMSNGEKKKGKLDNLEIEMIDIGELSDLPMFWNYTGILVFSERAKKYLESYLKDCVEFIPLLYKHINYYMLNVIKVVDAINYDSATFRKLDTGLVVGIDKYSFKLGEVNCTL